MKRLALALLYAIGGYLAGAVVGYLLVSALSSNTHDRALEAAMTGAFVCGPLVAIVAGVLGLVRRS